MDIKFDIKVAENHIKMAEALQNSGEFSRAKRAFESAAKQYRKLADMAPERRGEFENLANDCDRRAGTVTNTSRPTNNGGSSYASNNNKQQSGSNKAAIDQPAAPATPEDRQRAFNEGLDELNNLVGIKGVKEQVNKLIKVKKVDAERLAQGLPVSSGTQHLVFTGNPGTGKTTVARIIAKLYFGLGILPENKLVETDRSKLVAGYVGQTAIKTQEVVDSALGGVLFIDEAYTLSKGGEHDFGIEAIDTLLKAMEDNRGNLVVIVAGYSKQMEKFLDANEGLKSRFKNIIEFEDYTDEDLLKIFKILCKKAQALYREEDLKILKKSLEVERSLASKATFGNARTLRNLFEDIQDAQKMRLAEVERPTKEDLMTLLDKDFKHVYDNVRRKIK